MYSSAGSPHPNPLPREREFLSLPKTISRIEFIPVADIRSPSPVGEGWGEGNRIVQKPGSKGLACTYFTDTTWYESRAPARVSCKRSPCFFPCN